MDDPKVRADRALAPALVRAFERAKDDDPRIRRYLALAIGRLDPPLPAQAIDVLSASLDDPAPVVAQDWLSRLTGWSDSDISEVRISTIWALGASGDPRVAAKLQPLYESPDAGVRKMVVYALGALPGDAQLDDAAHGAAGRRRPTCAGTPPSRWRATGTARAPASSGRCSIASTSSRPSSATCGRTQDMDPIADVMISGLRAAAALKDETLREPIAALSQQDRSMKVRQAALEALKAMS